MLRKFKCTYKILKSRKQRLDKEITATKKS